MDKSLRAEDLKPQLIHSMNGDLLLQISVGGDTLTKLIPPMQTFEEAREYIDELVPEMAKELYRKRRNKRKRSDRSLR